MTPSEFDSWLLDLHRRPLVMGILNVTPDSFSDGGRFADPAAAIEHGIRMAEQGAAIIDIGGESTRPGAQRIDAPGQLRRILPVIHGLAGKVKAVLSVDTTLSTVAAAAIDAGAAIVNDISAGTEDPAMLPLVAARGASVILMHMQGKPATLQQSPHYDDVVAEVKAYLAQRAAAARSAGIAPHRILLDPGIGFGKTVEHNLLLLRDLRMLAELPHPLVLGTSRKSFIGKITGDTEPSQRVMGTAATVAWCVANRAAVVRVHDVEAMNKVVKVIVSIQRPGMGGG
jgi:dihydropteroate synthase